MVAGLSFSSASFIFSFRGTSPKDNTKDKAWCKGTLVDTLETQGEFLLRHFHIFVTI
jgi:hypothetical protein